MDKQFIVVVCGPTASGKTALSVELAKRLSGEIISADSMQIYRGMNVATAKPTEEEKQGIPHYLMDFLDPHDSFSVADYVKAAHGIIADIAARGKLPIITGGTGLYISSLIDNLSFEETECDYAYRDELRKLAQEKGNGFLLGMLRETDPETAEKLHENNLNRIIRALEVYKTTGKTMSEQQRLSRLAPSPYEPCMIQLDYDRETLYDRINRRVDIMLEQGLVEEARAIYDRNYDRSLPALQGLGYKQLFRVFDGEYTLSEGIEAIKQETRRFAKRQLTWFRRDRRITWLDVSTFESAEALGEEVCRICTRGM